VKDTAKESECLDRRSVSQHAVHRRPAALILCTEACASLGKLISRRCKAALPFAGKYRLVDFALSNCVNSGIETVGVITQYRPRSLNAHLAFGRPWGLNRHGASLTLLHPYQTGTGIGWYAGTAHAVHLNWDFVSHHRADELFILAGGEVCSLDLSALAAQHRSAKADLTIAAVPAGGKMVGPNGTLRVDCQGWVRKWISPASNHPGPLAVMGVLLFSTDALSRRLSKDTPRPDSRHDLICDVVSRMIEARDRVMSFRHAGSWRDLHTIRDYWIANLNLLGEEPGLNLQDRLWPIRTQTAVLPPAYIASQARVSQSLISEGCIIEGTVERSVLSPGVYVASGAVVRNAVVMHNATIKAHAHVENAVLDTSVVIAAGASVGEADRLLPTPVVVKQAAQIPALAEIEPALQLSLPFHPAERRDLSEAQLSLAR
jgi:glucose-1-phosphate adenylyltransferase